MKHSCGALLYTIDPEGRLGIVLGREFGTWSLFKGCREPDESFEDCAKREIFEETGGLLSVSNPHLGCRFSNKVKTYHIGLAYLPYESIAAFNTKPAHADAAFNEKEEMKFFEYGKIDLAAHHTHVRIAVQFYADQLDVLSRTQHNKTNDIHSVQPMRFAEWRAQGLRHGRQSLSKPAIVRTTTTRLSAATNRSWRMRGAQQNESWRVACPVR